MNRRNFAKTLGGGLVLPTMPLGALAQIGNRRDATQGTWELKDRQGQVIIATFAKDVFSEDLESLSLEDFQLSLVRTYTHQLMTSVEVESTFSQALTYEFEGLLSNRYWQVDMNRVNAIVMFTETDMLALISNADPVINHEIMQGVLDNRKVSNPEGFGRVRYEYDDVTEDMTTFFYTRRQPTRDLYVDILRIYDPVHWEKTFYEGNPHGNGTDTLKSPVELESVLPNCRVWEGELRSSGNRAYRYVALTHRNLIVVTCEDTFDVTESVLRGTLIKGIPEPPSGYRAW